MPHESRTRIVRPGEGVEVERVSLAPIKAEITKGTYVVNPVIRQAVGSALADINRVTKKEAKAILTHPDAKTFMNAYASLITDRMWLPYSRHVSGEHMGIYTFQFDKNGESSLIQVDPDTLRDANSSSVARALAVSNEAIMTHYTCAQFFGNQTPSVSDATNKSQEYFDTLKEMTDLGVQTGTIAPFIPKEAGTAAGFVTTGLRIIRTHIYGVPELMNIVTQRDGITLNIDQHRRGFEETMRGVTSHYYLPNIAITIDVNSQVIHPKTRELDPDKWTHNGDPDRLLVFPRPEIVTKINDEAKNKTLSVQTGCPAFSSRVTTAEAPELVIPLPRSLPELALQQLDTWYYPKLKTELASREA